MTASFTDVFEIHHHEKKNIKEKNINKNTKILLKIVTI